MVYKTNGNLGNKDILYTPSFVDKLTRILYSSIKDILPRIEYYYHKDSDAKISELIK